MSNIFLARDAGQDWSQLDGSKGAPAGHPQYPQMLNPYIAAGPPKRDKWNGRQPPWSVAGVDYHVGIDRVKYPTNGALTPAVSGGVLDSVLLLYANYNAPPTVSFTGPGPLTIEGYSFDQNSLLAINNCSGVIFKNCRFAATTTPVSALVTINSGTSNITFTQCEFDAGGASTVNSSYIMFLPQPSGNCVLTYNWFANSPCDCVQGGHATNVVFWSIKYNLFERGMYFFDAHADFMQFNLTGHYDNQFNTFYQPPTDVGSGAPGTPGSMQSGFGRLQADAQSNTGSSISYNTGVFLGPNTHVHDVSGASYDGAAVNAIFDISAVNGGILTGLTIANNYIDQSSKAAAGVYVIDGSGGTLTLTAVNNKDLNTGSVIPYP